MKKDYFIFSVKDMTEAGLMVALSLILNFLKVPLGATGGSINLQMLPLTVYSIRKGWFKGLIVSGLIFGLVSYLTDGYGLILTFPFDYFIGFGGCAIFGIFSKQILENKKFLISLILVIVCGVLATFIRILGSTLSSIIVFGYSFETALVYNLLYIPASGLSATLVVCLILSQLRKLEKK